LDGFVKQQRLVIVLVVLLVVAGLVWFRYLKSDSNVLTADASTNDQDYKPVFVEDPELHKGRIETARKTEYKSGGRNIFVAQAAPVVVAQAPQKPKPLPVGPQLPAPEPPPPPLTLPPNMKFYGYGTVPNGTARRAFFTDAEGEVYVVPEGGVLLNRFRIIKVGNATLEFEEISTGRRGTAPLEEQAAPSGATP
jgi:hypothetical protein